MPLDKALYDMIFKRKSFHLFRNIGDASISSDELEQIQEAYKTFLPLCPDIRTAIRIVPAKETTCRRGQEYCILLYSEKKENYLQNIGYLGEQLDLYLVSKNIGTLWFGIGKTEELSWDGLDFVIMIAMSRVDDEKKFRKDMFRSKRKPIDEIWTGRPIPGVTEIVRFAPSACNSQPWIAENTDAGINIYRYRKQGRSGIMPADKVSFYNRIDMGIFLCFLDLCLQHCGMEYTVERYKDDDTEAKKTKVAAYKLQ
ncbi:MAG: nitroreductase [Lachnospiraceae bacterium]|nr:nitroreductase [Lachnospiraceae bacterium]MDY5541519.1 nitroreductase family protein [Lachnospiraceae bacterium]